MYLKITRSGQQKIVMKYFVKQSMWVTANIKTYITLLCNNVAVVYSGDLFYLILRWHKTYQTAVIHYLTSVSGSPTEALGNNIVPLTLPHKHCTVCVYAAVTMATTPSRPVDFHPMQACRQTWGRAREIGSKEKRERTEASARATFHSEKYMSFSSPFLSSKCLMLSFMSFFSWKFIIFNCSDYDYLHCRFTTPEVQK